MSAVYMDNFRAALHHVKEQVAPYWTPENIFWSVFAFDLLIFVWEFYLKFRQYRLCVRTEYVPNELVMLTDPKTFLKSRKYRIDKARFSFAQSIVDELFSSAAFFVRLQALAWFTLGDIMIKYGYNAQNEYLRTAIFCLLSAFVGRILGLPWDLYYTFVLEEKHGFNKQTLRFFIWDEIKKFCVGQLIMLPCGGCVIYIIKLGGDWLFLYMWLFVLVLVFLLMTVYPDYIAPLFDKFTPLPEGPLREKIESLAKQLDFPLKKIFVVEGSKRSSHSNAYLYGIFKNKRIVLFDTLLKDSSKESSPDDQLSPEEVSSQKKGCTDDEVLAVLCHELGHWKHSHVMTSLIITEIHLFISFFIFGMLYKDPTVYKAFGFENEFPTMFGLLFIIGYIYSPYNTLMNFLMTALTRRNEFQADEFAKKMHKASYLRQALITLNNDNLSFPIDDPLYSAWFLTHPSLPERIEALGKLD